MSQTKSLIEGPRNDSLMSPIDPRLRGFRGSPILRQSGDMMLDGFPDGNLKGRGEKRRSATVGSPVAQDQLNNAVDLGHGTGSAAFMGKISESRKRRSIYSLCRLHQEKLWRRCRSNKTVTLEMRRSPTTSWTTLIFSR